MAKALLTLALLLSHCPLSFSETIIALGDSQTAVRAPLIATETYCHKMAERTGRACLNKGVGGNTSTDMLARFNADVIAQAGSCVVIMAGANDAFINPGVNYDYSTYWTEPRPSAVSVPIFKSNLTEMVKQARSAGKDVTLITPWTFFSTPLLIQFTFYADTVKEVGGLLGVPVLDADAIQRDLWWASKPWLTQNAAPLLWDLEVDYQHPSAAGHTRIADLCRKPQNATACACRT